MTHTVSRAHAELPLAARVFARLADGNCHSGEDLAGRLGVTRSAVWKAAAALRLLGVEISAVRNRGYRLHRACEPLAARRIVEHLPPKSRELISRIEVHWSIPSTNDALLALAPPPAGGAWVMLAEHQAAGRGRRGRAWLAPPGGSLCLSLSWTFGGVPRELSALSLVIGVCVQRALRRLGARALELKWPNDVLLEGRKLCGILIELRAESAGTANVVIGIGLNCALGARARAAITRGGLPPADLADAGLAAVSRNALAAGIVDECLTALQGYELRGAAPMLAEWRRSDALRGKHVTVQGAEGAQRGIARGVDVHGALLVETPAGLERHISGDVSVRFET